MGALRATNFSPGESFVQVKAKIGDKFAGSEFEQLRWPKGRRAGARSKKRSLYVINEHFETDFNAEMGEKAHSANAS